MKAAADEIERLRAGINRAGALCSQNANHNLIRDVLALTLTPDKER